MKRLCAPSPVLCGLLSLAAMVASPALFAADVEARAGPAILQELKNFREVGTVLYIAAHPDDENTQLITYLARGRHYRTGYLSITRGDGGQNVIGPEFDEELGVIRTQELLAARRLDGGRQFFTRAIDFGFSKDYQDTLKLWGHQPVLSDVVRVIRTFQPDVVVAGFSTQPGGTHGHHTASAVLAGEAFKLAGDPKAFPEQLTYLKPWQPKRLVQSLRGNRGGAGADTGLRIDVGGMDPVLGISFGEIAGRSRAMHKSQGFGNFGGGGGGGGGPQYQSFQFLDGAPATNDVMEGVDTTWNRVPGGADIGKQADEIIAKFDPNDPSASVSALLVVRTNLAALSGGSLIEEKRRQLDKILQNCLGLSVVTTLASAEVVPGEALKLHSTASVRSTIPVTWNGGQDGAVAGRKLIPGQTMSQDTTRILPANTPLTQPYWLREDREPGMFRVEDPRLIGSPESPAAFSLQHLFVVGGQSLVVEDVPVQAGTESGKFEARRTLKVIAPVSLRFENEVALFGPGGSRDVSVEVLATRADTKGELSVDAPAGWKITPAHRSFQLASAGQRETFSFKVTAPREAAPAQFTARAKIGGASYDSQRIEISYPHIPEQVLQPPARIRAVPLDLAIRGKRVGYVPGAGDRVAEALKQMGYDVTTLTGAELTTNRLQEFDAVVIGIRAFNVRTDLVAHLPDLFAFVAAGGNVIEQYNRPGGDLKTEQLAPYRLRLSGDRVTDENASMTFLAPDHPALNTPNKITPADFTGWVQERGIYFPDQWDEHFVPILACADAGEAPKSGALLVAPYGKGHFVYTGLVFFRELPAGVPGAYRLLANLISLGK